LIQRNLQPVRARETTVNFSIDIKDRVALGHFADLLHIEGSGPGSVEKENSQTANHDQAEKRELPPETEKLAVFLLLRTAPGKEFHRKDYDNLATDWHRLKRVLYLKGGSAAPPDDVKNNAASPPNSIEQGTARSTITRKVSLLKK
jgi:hypothetical protein